ncbi:hypothetical protein BDQ17DRAFT_1415379 [Cyathus striatus]|nr:hypothetical protein BDQ17DRAFT_1415379 [Cyathus striatus]
MSKFTVGSDNWHTELDETIRIPKAYEEILSKDVDTLDKPILLLALAKVIGCVVISAAAHGFQDWDNSFYPQDEKFLLLYLQNYINDNEELAEIAQRCWQTRSFKEIREFKPILSQKRANGNKDSVYSFLESTVEKGWQEQYRGELHRLLLYNFNNMCRENIKSPTDYGNSIPIIQSSGTGKSRMIDEAASFVFTIPFNLRNLEESLALTYPPPDVAVSGYMRTEKQYDEACSRVLIFLKNLFNEISNELLRYNVGTYKKAEQLASWWKNHLSEAHAENPRETRRSYLYNKIISMSNVQLKEIGALDKLSESTSNALGSLLKSIPQDSDASLQLLMCFDEADTLTSHTIMRQYQSSGILAMNSDMYHVVLHCLNELTNYPTMLAVFLSRTVPSVSKLTRGTYIAKSSRLAQSTRIHLPITEIAFDCSPEFPLPLSRGELKLGVLSDLHFMAQFGRPLWRSLFTREVVDRNLGHVVLMFAKEKLLNKKDFTFSPYSMGDLGVLATLDVLVSLTYEPFRLTTLNQEAELVAKHMRLAYAVSIDRLYVNSGYSSEPILAEAASQVMGNFEKEHPNAMVMILSHHVNQGAIDVGQRGELVSRLLFTMAYRRATEKSLKSRPKKLYSEGCGVVPFLEELYTDENINEILDHVPNNWNSGSNSRSIREAFANSWLRFTHFGRMGDDSGVTSHAILAAIARGMAIICFPSQSMVDIIYPVLLDKDKPLSESNMTAILVQVKNHDNAGPIAKYEIDEEDIGVFPDDSDSVERPYIAIVMELGVQGRINPCAITHRKAQGDAEQERSAKKLKISHDYSTPTQGHVRLLKPPKHAARSTIDAIRKMQQFYSRSATSYGWTDISYLCGKQSESYVQPGLVQVGVGDEDEE